MSNSNWPFRTNLGHPNFTGITPSKSSGYAPNSDRIPLVAWFWTVVVVALFFAMFYIGAAVGF